MPHIGGIGIFLGFSIGLIAYRLLARHINADTLLPFSRLIPFFSTYLVIHLTGIIDDFANLKARYKFIVQIILAVVLCATAGTIRSVSFPGVDAVINLGPFSFIITTIWLVGVCNALNFIDGIDGLAGGTAGIAAIFFAAVSFLQGQTTTAIFSLALFGGIVGFLAYNKPPAKIIMGDSGSLFLGFVLASLPLLESTERVGLVQVLVPISLLLVPIFDTFASIIRRTRRGKAFYIADKLHTHHKLLDLGLSQPKVLMVIYSLCLLPSGAVLAWVAIDSSYLIWLVVAAWISCAAFFVYLDRVYYRRHQIPEA